MRRCSLHEVETEERFSVFILKISCFLFARYWQLTLKWFPLSYTGAVWRGSQKYKTFRFLVLLFSLPLAVHLKNRYPTHRLAVRAISVFRVKFDVEFTRRVVNFFICTVEPHENHIWIHILRSYDTKSRTEHLIIIIFRSTIMINVSD